MDTSTNKPTPPAKNLLACAAIQMCSRSDLEVNLATCERLAERARAQGAELIAFPENFAYIGDPKEKIALAEEISDTAQGMVMSRMRALAIRLGAHLVLGGTPEEGTVAGKVFNTCAWLGPDGKLVARYRKIHLFDIDIANGPTFTESATIEGGREPVCVGSPWGPMGLSICYDLRFPELYRTYAKQGARVLFVPAAFTMHTGKDHWQVLLRARAIENLAYVVAPAQWGNHTPTRQSYGKALICDPWGIVVAEASDRDGFALAQIDLGYVDEVRQQLPALTHRRL